MFVWVLILLKYVFLLIHSGNLWIVQILCMCIGNYSNSRTFALLKWNGSLSKWIGNSSITSQVVDTLDIYENLMWISKSARTVFVSIIWLVNCLPWILLIVMDIFLISHLRISSKLLWCWILLCAIGCEWWTH